MGELSRFGIIGLGKMGGNLALQALQKKWQVVGNSIGGVSPDLLRAGVAEAKSLKDFRELLVRPRAIFLYIPAGAAVDTLLDDLTPLLDEGDIILDGGNSYWGDSIARAKKLKDKKINFIDLGTSGGMSGAREGACFMAGGEKSVVDQVAPLLRDLAVPEGFVHAGPSGAGHFTKLIHNGIEFGMLQAIGEGMALLEKFPNLGEGEKSLPIENILHCWNHGSVIRSWLVELMEKGFVEEKAKGEKIPAYVEDTGEVNWLVSDALHFEVPIPVIAQSVMQLFASRDLQKPWARAIAIMRHGFGGHPYGEDAGIKKERRTGRRSDYFLPKN